MTYGHLHITMILPRRTRDKHGESTLKRGERLPSIINAGAAGAPRWLINDKFTPDSEQCIASIETAVRRKTFFVRPVFFNSKMITLPRQARDKHTDRKHSQDRLGTKKRNNRFCRMVRCREGKPRGSPLPTTGRPSRSRSLS